ncbi:MAG TPA: L,D-transpeptidase family protein [Gemmatimonadales bacterium]
MASQGPFVTRRVVTFGLALTFVAAPLRAQDSSAPFLRATLDAGRLPTARRADLADVDSVIGAFYAARGDAPVWDQGQGYTQAARAAIVTLRVSDERGLDPRDYDVAQLDSLAEAAPDSIAEGRAARDLLLTVAITRYLRDLREGRVAGTPFAHVKERTPIPVVVGELQRAGSGVPLESLAREVEPHLAQYRNLLRQLARYRQLVTTLDLRPLPTRVARPGQRYAGTAELWRRLVAYGDLPSSTPYLASARYDSVLAEGVRRFQVRHALTPDGVIGAGTRQALSVRPEQRVRQIELALERLRWLPSLEGQRLIVVNVPGFELFAFDSIGGAGAPTLRMPVVIGDSFDHRTPVMLQPLTTVEFRPFWNVPRKIMQKEMLPVLAGNPLWLRRQHMDVLGVRDSILGDSVDAQMLAGLAAGRLRIRQQPGPWNALGLTKFSFPNRSDIYLHGTPDTLAFTRARRDLSHGCIRVQDPPALALWALRDARDWDLSRIDAALTGTDTLKTSVPRGISVLIFYTTAVATPEGEVVFYQDIYGHDRALQGALRAGERGTREGI